MKKLLLYIVPLLLLLPACTGQTPERSDAGRRDSVPVMVMQIRKCSKLYSAEYRVRKIVTHDDRVEFKGTFFSHRFNIPVPMSSRKVAIPIDAKLKAYIDFGSFSEKNITVSGENIEITLPDPRVELTSSRIDHEAIKRHVPLIRSNFTDAELAEYERQGREQIIRSIPGLGIIGMARESAAHILVPMLVRLGYKEENITITFRKDFTAEDLPLLLENNNIEYGKQQ